MKKVMLGKTGLMVTRTAMGCLPIQRVDFDTAKAILRRAYDAGINFFDTANAYSDSEKKIGYALADVRENIIIATKSGAKTGEELTRHVENSLASMKTDYVDILQFHNANDLPKPGAEDGRYDAAVALKEAGKIRHIGITCHSMEAAFKAVESGLYETLQYPFNHLSTEKEIELVKLCAEKNVGFICMKGMSGGLITNARIPFAFIRQFENAVPIWGVQRMSEIEEFIELENSFTEITPEMLEEIAKDRAELAGAFCRSCGYCMPCPVGIPINNANRMKELITRSPYKNWITPTWREGMEKIEDCINCGKCAEKCPYGLKPYETLPGQLKFYREFCKEHADEL